MSMLEIGDKIGLIMEIVGRADLMNQEIDEDYLTPMEFASREGDTSKIRMLAIADGHRARLKSQILSDLIENIASALREVKEMAQPTKEADLSEQPSKDHSYMTRTERIDEILNQMNENVGRIELLPDWLERMKFLYFTSIMLARGGDYGANITNGK